MTAREGAAPEALAGLGPGLSGGWLELSVVVRIILSLPQLYLYKF